MRPSRCRLLSKELQSVLQRTSLRSSAPSASLQGSGASACVATTGAAYYGKTGATPARSLRRRERDRRRAPGADDAEGAAWLGAPKWADGASGTPAGERKDLRLDPGEDGTSTLGTSAAYAAFGAEMVGQEHRSARVGGRQEFADRRQAAAEGDEGPSGRASPAFHPLPAACGDRSGDGEEKLDGHRPRAPPFFTRADVGKRFAGKVQMVRSFSQFWGYIRMKNSSKRDRVFFHLRDSVDRLPRKNDVVEFELACDDENKFRAVKVRGGSGPRVEEAVKTTMEDWDEALAEEEKLRARYGLNDPATMKKFNKKADARVARWFPGIDLGLLQARHGVLENAWAGGC